MARDVTALVVCVLIVGALVAAYVLARDDTNYRDWWNKK